MSTDDKPTEQREAARAAAKAKAKSKAKAAPKQEEMREEVIERPSVPGGKKMMDEKYVLKSAWWCTYCGCGGLGCAKEGEALAFFRLLTKCCCARVNCESHGDGLHEGNELEGCFQGIFSCVFCHLLCQLPGRPGMPRCICCSEQVHDCGRYARPVLQEHQINIEAGTQPMFEFLIYDGCTPAWCCCLGCSCKKEIMSLMKFSFMCCGYNFLCEEAMPDCEEGPCTCFFTSRKCYAQCACPPMMSGNPICACCGKRWRTKKHTRGNISGKSDGSGGSAPKQQEMS